MRLILSRKNKATYFLRLGLFTGVVIVFAVLFVKFGVYPAPNNDRTQQRLIQWGHHTPRLQDIANYSEQLAELPFDGLILDIATPNDGRGLAWTIFEDPVDSGLLDEIREQFADYDWGHLSDNFLRVNIYNPELTWDDWDIALDNLPKIAELAYDLGFKGIVFDTEQYGAVNIFDYPAQNASDPRPFDEYRQLAFQRGIETMQALQNAYPDITVIYTYGITQRIVGVNSPPLDEHRYGLLVPFIEGMVSAVQDSATLIDGFEGSYLYRTEEQFSVAYRWIRGGISSQLSDGEGYRNAIQAGFGLWIDPYCGDGGLPDSGCGFTPDEFETALLLALQYSDRYVWLYNEHIDWFENKGIPTIWRETMDQFKQE